MIINKRQRSQN